MAQMIGATLILFLYAVLILILCFGFIKTPVYHTTTVPAKIKFSIIIPYKNEAKNLSVLLGSLQKLEYPKSLFEIILVDDSSMDTSYQIVDKQTFVKNLKNAGTGKKSALHTGILQAKHPWIITTDADCTLPQDWLKIFNDFIIENQPKMVLGPVKYFDTQRFVDQFQQFEFLSLQAFTIAVTYCNRPFLANGANLAFEKQAFFEVGAYIGNENIASGDDVFLLEKFAKAYPKKIYFLKSDQAIVQTKTQADWTGLLQQKVRWASKSKYQKNIWSKITGIIVLLANFMLIFAFFSLNWWFISIKFLLDVMLLLITNRFYKTRLNWGYFIGSFVMYPFYLIIVAFLSLKGDYVWKGRKVSGI